MKLRRYYQVHGQGVSELCVWGMGLRVSEEKILLYVTYTTREASHIIISIQSVYSESSVARVTVMRASKMVICPSEIAQGLESWSPQRLEFAQDLLGSCLVCIPPVLV